MIDPELELNDLEQAQLATLVNSQGWPVLKKVMQSKVEQFNVDLLNVSNAKTEEIVAKHAIAKAAAMYATMLITELESIKLLLVNRLKQADEEPEDYTQGILDMDDLITVTQDIPSFL